MSNIVFENRLPTPKEWATLRAAANWTVCSDTAFLQAIRGSLFGICAVSGTDIVASGRVVGDNALCFYMQDLVVIPEYRKQGIGTAITGKLLKEIQRRALPGAFVGMFAAKKCEHLYRPFGFISRPNEAMGSGMILRLP